eukprot:2494732-Amphidinium_carterae.1
MAVKLAKLGVVHGKFGKMFQQHLFLKMSLTMFAKYIARPTEASRPPTQRRAVNFSGQMLLFYINMYSIRFA